MLFEGIGGKLHRVAIPDIRGFLQRSMVRLQLNLLLMQPAAKGRRMKGIEPLNTALSFKRHLVVKSQEVVLS